MANGRRWFRRKPAALVAGGRRYNLNNSQAIKLALEAHEQWQDQAWQAFDAVGEIKYGTHVLASLVSRNKVFVAEPPEEKDNAPRRSENTEAIQVLERLGSPTEIADLLYDIAVNLLVPGECWLVCLGEREDDINENNEVVREGHPETWFVRSIDEVKSEADVVQVVDIDTSDAVQRWIKLDETKDDAIIRIWRQHNRQHHLADSHVRAILDPAEELLWWDAASRARAKSRISDTGVVAIPSDIELPAESEDEAELTGSERAAKRIYEAAIEPIKNPSGSAAQVAPITVTYPANEQRHSGIEHITIDRPQDELLEKRTDRCLQRIEQGLNLPVGVISGLGKATHWGGGQIEESTFREHVEPLVLLILGALTKAFLRPLLSSDSQLLLWYDNSNLIVHQDKSTNAIRALELGGIGWPTLRRELGLSERDAPTEEELISIREHLGAIRRGTGQQGIVANPDVPDEPSDPSAPPSRNAPGERTPRPQPAAPLKRRGQNPVAASVQAMADEKIRRAHEKAGNKLRSRSKKIPAYSNAIRGVKSDDVARTLGREACIKLGIDDIFDGCFSDLTNRFAVIVEETSNFGEVNKFRKFVQERAAETLFEPYTDNFLISVEEVENYLALACPETWG